MDNTHIEVPDLLPLLEDLQVPSEDLKVLGQTLHQELRLVVHGAQLSAIIQQLGTGRSALRRVHDHFEAQSDQVGVSVSALVLLPFSHDSDLGVLYHSVEQLDETVHHAEETVVVSVHHVREVLTEFGGQSSAGLDAVGGNVVADVGHHHLDIEVGL